jgi:hypothetical protein
MKYLLALIGDESQNADRTPEEMAAAMRGWDDYTRAVQDAGVYVGGEGLQPSAAATTVKLPTEGDPVVTDGPFAETKEQLGGYYLIDVEDLDAALDWAKKIPMPGGNVEVRPVMDYDQAGSEMHSNEPEGSR